VTDKYLELGQEIYAWTTIMPDGRYSVIAAFVGGHHLPLVTANRSSIEKARDVARMHGNAAKQKVMLVKFSGAEILESFEPGE
jgi:hypothetical protein